MPAKVPTSLTLPELPPEENESELGILVHVRTTVNSHFSKIIRLNSFLSKGHIALGIGHLARDNFVTLARKSLVY
jgi:hypothetical protein